MWMLRRHVTPTDTLVQTSQQQQVNTVDPASDPPDLNTFKHVWNVQR